MQIYIFYGIIFLIIEQMIVIFYCSLEINIVLAYLFMVFWDAYNFFRIPDSLPINISKRKN